MRQENLYLQWNPHQNEGVSVMRQWSPTFSQKKYFLSQMPDAGFGTKGERTPYRERPENTPGNWWHKDEFRKQL